MIMSAGKELKEVRSDSVVRTQEFFSDHSPLKRAAEFGGRAYERRIQQETMAVAVAEALEENHNLCVEAPTGVGKSFAYLVPAIYHARATRTLVLVTTETITLQEQLVNKDLPLLKELTGLDFTFVLAKGRSNYLCKRRLDLATNGGYGAEMLPTILLEDDVLKLRSWASGTQTGSKSEISFRLDPMLWQSVCCETANCLGPKCPFYQECFYWKNRKTWDKADIVVTNHALFFTDLKIRELEMQENCPLPVYGAVIFDEAHTLEDNAANHLGIHVSNSSLRYFLNRLFNPSNGRGLMMKSGSSSMMIRGKISALHDSLAIFFSQFDMDLERNREDCLRLPKNARYENNFTGQLADLEKILEDYIDQQESPEFKTELNSQLERSRAFRDEIDSFIKMSLEDQVYWVEGHDTANARYRNIELTSAPLNVADLLRKILFTKDFPVILTSATLAVKESLDYYAARVGFCGGEGLILDSPFDYSKQVTLYLSRSMPQPNEKDYNDAAAEKIRDFVDLTKGRAFVLFTSFAMLKYCSDSLAPHFSRQGIQLLTHGEEMSRSAMLEEFRRDGSSVIFGASSFWTGVDVPGDALSNVIITKLPFAVPNHPLIQARCERITEDGGDPFRDYSIPDAVLKFRQGIGRLIRSKTDKGIIVVLDPRIISRSYGRNFLYSIPRCPVEYF